jgi:hypothetical protein
MSRLLPDIRSLATSVLIGLLPATCVSTWAIWRYAAILRTETLPLHRDINACRKASLLIEVRVWGCSLLVALVAGVLVGLLLLLRSHSAAPLARGGCAAAILVVLFLSSGTTDSLVQATKFPGTWIDPGELTLYLPAVSGVVILALLRRSLRRTNPQPHPFFSGHA